MQAARPDEIKEGDRAELSAIDPDRGPAVSGKTGAGRPGRSRAIIDRVPPPAGDPNAPAPGPDLRLQVRRLPGRDHLRPGRRRHAPQGRDRCPPDGGRDRARGQRARPVPPAQVPATSWGSGRSATSRPTSRPLRRRGRRHDHRPRTRPEALPGYQEPSRGRLLRPLPGHAQPVRRPPRRAPEARAQRRTLHLRARDLRRARLRLPLRLPRHAPHGDRPADASSARATSPRRRPPPTSPTRSFTRKGETLHISNPTRIPDAGEHRGVPRADRQGQLHPPVGRVHRRDHAALRGPPRDVSQDRVHRPPAPSSPTSCRWPR